MVIEGSQHYSVLVLCRGTAGPTVVNQTVCSIAPSNAGTGDVGFTFTRAVGSITTGHDADGLQMRIHPLLSECGSAYLLVLN